MVLSSVRQQPSTQCFARKYQSFVQKCILWIIIMFTLSSITQFLFFTHNESVYNVHRLAQQSQSISILVYSTHTLIHLCGRKYFLRTNRSDEIAGAVFFPMKSITILIMYTIKMLLVFSSLISAIKKFKYVN